MKEMTCIVCPNGCLLMVEEIEDKVMVTGNKCKRGEEFAVTELTNPMRTICSTVRTIFPEVPVLPVRVSKEIPKDKIFEVMEVINQVVIKTPVTLGDVIVEHVLGLDVDIIVTSNLLREGKENEKSIDFNV